MTPHESEGLVELDSLLAKRGWVRALARQLVGDDDLADDIVQETWLAALRQRPKHPRAISAWLSSVVRFGAARSMRDDHRRTMREEAVAKREIGPPTDEVVAETEMHRLVVDACLELDEPYRSTVLLRYFRGLDSTEIGRLQNLPPGTVRTHLRRGIARLRERLDRPEDRRTLTLGLLFASSRAGGVPPASAAASGAAGTAIGFGGWIAMSTNKIAMTVVAVAAIVTSSLLFLPRDSKERNTSATSEPLAMAARGERIRDDRARNEAVDPTARTSALATPSHGTVVDAWTGEPIVGAVVVLERSTPGGESVLARTVTNEDGRYRIDLARASGANEIRLVARSDEYVPQIETLGLPPLGIRLPTMALRRGVAISGVVTDDAGRSVGPGRMRVRSSCRPSYLEGRGGLGYGSRYEYEIPIERDGSFRATVDPSRTMLTVDVPGYAPYFTEPFDPKSEERHEISIARGQSLHGVVRDAEGSPIHDAEIRALCSRGPSGYAPFGAIARSVRSDRAGRFEIAGLSAESLIEAEHTGFVPWSSETDVLTSDSMTIMLERGTVLRGALIDSAGDAVTSATGSFRSDDGSFWLTTDPHGAFHTPALRSTTNEATLEMPGFAPTPVSWEPAQGVVDVGAVRLESGSRLRVRVRDRSGLPVDGSFVEIDTQPPATAGMVSNRPTRRTAAMVADADGIAELAFDPAVLSVLRVSTPGYHLVERSLAADSSTDLEIVLGEDVHVRGRLTSAAGEPVAGNVTFARARSDVRVGASRTVTASADRDGRFHVALDLGEGDYTCTATAPGFASRRYDLRGIATGGDRDLGVLTLDEGITLSGVVVDPEGDPIRDVFVRTWGGGGSDSTVTSDEGRFRLSGLGDGTVNLEFLSEAFLPFEMSKVSLPRPAAEEMRVVLDRGVLRKTRLVDAGGTGIAGTVLFVQSSGGRTRVYSDAEGVVSIRVPDRGAVELRSMARGFLRYRQTFSSVLDIPDAIELSRGSTVRILVSSPESTETPDKLHVRLHLPSRSSGRSTPVSVRDGVATLSGIESGDYEYILTSGSVHPIVTGSFTLEPETTLDLPYPPAFLTDPATIRVLSAAREPIPGAKASLYWTGGVGRQEVDPHFIGDSSGLIRIPPVSDASFDLDLFAEGYSPVHVTDLFSELVDGALDVILESGGSIRFVARTAQGDSVSGVRVRLVKLDPLLVREHSTDSSGEALFADLPTGAFRLSISHRGRDLDKLESHVSAGNETVVEYTVPEQYEIEGLLRVGSERARGGKLTFQGPTRSRIVSSVSASGEFRIGLAANVSYRPVYESPDSVFTELEPVRITGAEFLELSFPAHDVVVDVVDPEGRPVVPVSLRLQHASSEETVAWAQLHESNRHEWTGVTPGEYRLLGGADTDWTGPWMRVRVPAGGPIRYAVRPTQLIRFDVEGPSVRMQPYRITAEGLIRLQSTRRGEPAFAWPAADGGVGVVEIDGRAPTFFSVLPDATEPIVIRNVEGARLKVLDDAPQGSTKFRVMPVEVDPGHAPYWAGRSFDAGMDVCLPPGDYRITLVGEDEVQAAVSLVEGELREVTVGGD